VLATGPIHLRRFPCRSGGILLRIPCASRTYFTSMSTMSRSEPTHSPEETQRGLRYLLLDGMASQTMGVFTTGAFLVAFALHLGASNVVIGLIAAIQPFSQIIQVPAIYLVARYRKRRALVVLSCIASRLPWFGVAAIPFLLPEVARIPALLLGLCLYFGFGAIASCSYNSWMRDFIPEKILGSYFAKRMTLSTALGAALCLVAGFAVDFYQQQTGDTMGIYSIYFVIGGVAGLIGTVFLSRIPEPEMADPPTEGMRATLLAPFRHANFRNLITFLGVWNLAINFAAPFFTVYMLSRLGLSMGYVLALSVVSQIMNVLFFRVWGNLADRFSNKSVLSVSGAAFVFSFLLWPFTTLPESHRFTLPLLVGIHVLAGISTAGVALCSSNITLKAAPRGQATAFLAVNGLVTGLAATIAPICGGFLADYFSTREFSFVMHYGLIGGPSEAFTAPALNLRGLDFLFVLAFFLGLYALHRLLAVREEGEVEERIVVQEFYGEVRKFARSVSNIAGMRSLTYAPFGTLREERRRHPRQSGRSVGWWRGD